MREEDARSGSAATGKVCRMDGQTQAGRNGPRRLSARDREKEEQIRSTIGRRGFFKLIGLRTLGLGFGVSIFDSLFQYAGSAVVSDEQKKYLLLTVGTVEFMGFSAKEITPNDEFYMTTYSEKIPEITYDAHKLRIEGLVRKPYTLTMKQLEEMKDVMAFVTLQCIGNPVMSEVDRFVDYLRNVRGLEPSTIEFHTCYVKEFLGHLGYDLNTNVIATLAVKQVDDFLCVCAKRLNRYSLQHVVAFLRTFLRFQHEQGILRNPLHTMIDTPRIYRFEQIPHALPWETVNRPASRY